jgi:hypothetical protein
MQKPKLALAPSPSLSLDAPLSLTGRDGSGLNVTPKGVLLVEAQKSYLVSPFTRILSLVPRSSGRMKRSQTGQQEDVQSAD